MGDTSISWTDKTWNPVRGCSRVSEGCRNCYAERIAARFSGPGQSYAGLARRTVDGPRWTGKVKLLPTLLDQPRHWRQTRRVFVNSMSDLFHEQIPDEFIDQIFAVMALCQQHVFQILSKRPERMREYLCDSEMAGRVARAVDTVNWRDRKRHGNGGLSSFAWPLCHVHVGVSVEDQETANERIPWLLKTPAAVRFISYEPALASVRLDVLRWREPGFNCEREVYPFAGVMAIPDHDWDVGKIDWVICGAESGPGARPMNEDWVRSVRDQCQAAGTAFFYKQKLDERGRKVELPLLDGRRWEEFPGHE